MRTLVAAAILIATSLTAGCVPDIQQRPQWIENNSYVGRPSKAASLKTFDQRSGKQLPETAVFVDQAGNIGIALPIKNFVLNSTQRDILTPAFVKYGEWCEIAKREKVDVDKLVDGAAIMMYGTIQPYQTWSFTPKIVSSNGGENCQIEIHTTEMTHNVLDTRYNYNMAFHTGMKTLETKSLSYTFPPEDAAKLADIFRNPGKYAAAGAAEKAKSDELFK